MPHTKLRQRLEANAKLLFALYQYGHLHGGVRLRWGFLDEMTRVPWDYPEEPTLYNIKRKPSSEASLSRSLLAAHPGWTDPWLRGQLGFVEKQAV